MPSDMELHFFQLCARYASNSCVFGVDNNRQSGKFHPTKSKTKLAIHYTFVACMNFMGFYCVHRIIVTYRAALAGSVEMAFFLVYGMLTVGHLIPIYWFICFVMNRFELIHLWNQLFQCCLNHKTTDNRNLIRDRYLWYAHYILNFATLCGSIVASIPEYMYASKQGHAQVISLGVPIFTFGIIWAYRIMFGLLISYALMFFFIVSDVLQSENTYSKSEEKIIKYRMLLVLCELFNGSYAKTIIPSLKYSMTFAGMIGFFIACRVKMLHSLVFAFLVVALSTFASSSILANALSVLWSMSSKNLGQISSAVANSTDLHRRNKLYLRKVLASLKPLRICVGGLYYMERKAKLTFLQFLVNGNKHLLLTFKNHV